MLRRPSREASRRLVNAARQRPTFDLGCGGSVNSDSAYTRLMAIREARGGPTPIGTTVVVPKVDKQLLAETPLLEAVHSTCNDGRVPFHMPGHKRGAGGAVQFEMVFGERVMRHDTTELPMLDNLQCATGVLKHVQELAANAWGAAQTFFLVNGTSVGNHAAIWSMCGPGDKVLLQRNAHKSVIAGLIMSGSEPVFLTPEYSTELQAALSVTAESVERALALHDGIRAVQITRPTYEGHCADVAAISKVCHAKGVSLIVDEAHGAHLAFGKGLTPPSAVSQGADIVVQSNHKTMGALTQASMLHVCHNAVGVDPDRIQSCLNLLQTSSPSYVLMSSLDAARAQVMADDGEAVSKIAVRSIAAGRRINAIPGVSVFGIDNYGTTQDPTRLTVVVSQLGISGFAAKDILYNEYKIAPELASPNSVSFIVSTGNTVRDLNTLAASLEHLATRCLKDNTVTNLSVPAPESALTSTTEVPPRDVFASQTEWVSLPSAAGRISADLICPYPPGIPVVMPGERVSAEQCKYVDELRVMGCQITGLDECGKMSVLK